MQSQSASSQVAHDPYIQKLMGNNEQPVFLTRKHLIVIARSLLGGTIAAIIILAAASIAAGLTAPMGGVGGLLGILVLIPLAQVIATLLKWSNEKYIVTNRRVMKIEGIVNKHVFDSSLEKVNDVQLDQSALGRMLNYGDVEIITGSDIGANKFQHIGDPVTFKREMLNQKEAMGAMGDFGVREHRVLTSDAPSKGDVPELIAELDELRKKGIISDAEFEAKKADLLKRL